MCRILSTLVEDPVRASGGEGVDEALREESIGRRALAGDSPREEGECGETSGGGTGPSLHYNTSSNN